jgi:hypothetical protein
MPLGDEEEAPAEDEMPLGDEEEPPAEDEMPLGERASAEESEMIERGAA